MNEYHLSRPRKQSSAGLKRRSCDWASAPHTVLDPPSAKVLINQSYVSDNKHVAIL